MHINDGVEGNLIFLIVAPDNLGFLQFLFAQLYVCGHLRLNEDPERSWHASSLHSIVLKQSGHTDDMFDISVKPCL